MVILGMVRSYLPEDCISYGMSKGKMAVGVHADRYEWGSSQFKGQWVECSFGDDDGIATNTWLLVIGNIIACLSLPRLHK